MLQFTAVMLPYVMLVCGGAFLSAILQVHKRFGPPAFAPIILNVCHIGVVLCGAWFLGLRGRDPQTPRVVELQTKLAFALAVTVLIAGALQVAILLPALRQIGFVFRPRVRFWTPAVRRMLCAQTRSGLAACSPGPDRRIPPGSGERSRHSAQRKTLTREESRAPLRLEGAVPR